MIPEKIIKELTQIPGVGTSIATDLYNIGIRCISDLKDKDPQQLYDASNRFAYCIQDKCLLYVFRCAVYFAATPASEQDPEKLKWWNWKDEKNILKSSRLRIDNIIQSKNNGQTTSLPGNRPVDGKQRHGNKRLQSL